MNKEKYNCKYEGYEGYDYSEYDYFGYSYGGKSVVVLFFLGFVVYIVGFFIKDNDIIRNVLNILVFVLLGYYIIIEGVIDIIKVSIKVRRFKLNIYLLMLVVVVGVMIIIEYREVVLFILIFVGVYFFEEYVEGRSKKEIINLFKLNLIIVRLIKIDGNIEIVDVLVLKIGDKL